MTEPLGFAVRDPKALVPREDKLPWLEAVMMVTLQIPWVHEQIKRGQYKRNSNPVAGLCYVASEAVYHLSEDPLQPMTVRFGSLPGDTHWWLTNPAEDDRIIDVTGGQFDEHALFSVYSAGRRAAFLTKYPSKRCRLILDRIDRGRYYRKTFPTAKGKLPYDLAVQGPWR